MTMIEVPAVKGRRVKFTPERIEQIRNLVERGLSREEIAAMIDVTVGSLQVTCSRLGISLRKPRDVPRLRLASSSDEGNGPNAPPSMVTKKDNGDGATLSLLITLRGRERRVALNLPIKVINDLALEAAIKNCSIAEVVAARIIAGGNKTEDQ